MKASPRRSCVVCRGVDEPKNLLRFVVSTASNELTVDEEGTMPGRGAYCHLRGDCIKHPKLADALVASLKKGSLTRRAKSSKDGAPKVSVGRVMEQLRSIAPSREEKKSRTKQSNRIRL